MEGPIDPIIGIRDYFVKCMFGIDDVIVVPLNIMVWFQSWRDVFLQVFKLWICNYCLCGFQFLLLSLVLFVYCAILNFYSWGRY